jgi:23S rRNA (pseudouridine1915-N3)-methyltransferase
MKITIAVTGKPKSAFIVDGIERYLKWLGPYGRIKLTYLPLERSSGRNRTEVKEREGKKYIELANTHDSIVLLHEEGEEVSSTEFAKMVQKWQNIGVRNLAFFVGGPYGFSNAVLSMEWQKLSLSRMTFTHEMALLLILEQLYRAHSIIGNRTYHY